jgi:lipoprotein-releasing system ATP-binding protein
MNEHVICCQDLSKSYVQGELNVTVLKDVNFNLRKSECMAIVGASGTGKSTLLHLLGGLETPDTGVVHVNGQNLAQVTEAGLGRIRNKSLGFVYQFHHLLSEFTAIENVAMPLLIRKTPANIAKEKSIEMLTRVGLEHRLLHKPGELSGGERQRAAIARAIVTEPDCILADEPTGNLDEKTAKQVFNVLLELNQAMNISMIMVSHNTGLIKSFDKILTLHSGTLNESGRQSA